MPAARASTNESLHPATHGAASAILSRRWRGEAILLLTVLTIVVWSPVLQLDFVNYDDDDVVVNNEHVHDLGSENLKWMFTSFRVGHYHPLTWLSLAIDYRVYGGLRPMGFHLTNLLLHLAVVVGVFLLSQTLIAAAHQGSDVTADRHIGNVPASTVGALFAAALYAVHPLRVESVAWITERRDVLSGALLLGAVVLYTGRRGGQAPPAHRACRIGAWILFVLSLLSKAWGITLPVVLLILDVYPLHRIRWDRDGRLSVEAGVWREKLAFVIPAVAAGVAAFLAQRASGAMQPLDSYTLWMRLVQAPYALGFYAAKLFWPVNLAPFYGWPEDLRTLYVPAALSAAGIIAGGWALHRGHRHRPGLLTAALCSAVVVSPVLGLVQSGPQLVADRYTYLASIPWSILLGGVLVRMMGDARRGRTGVAISVAVVVIAGMAFQTRRQIWVWKDARTLWEHHLEVRPWCPVGHVNYGSALFDEAAAVEPGARPSRDELLVEAFTEYARAAELRPSYVIAVRGAGRCLMALRRHEEARGWFERALELREDDPVTWVDLGDALAAMGRLDEALQWYRRAAASGGKEAYGARYEAGRRLHEAGRFEESAQEFEEAMRLKSTDVTCYQGLAEARIALHEDARAIDCLESALRLAPDSISVRARLAFVLASTEDNTLRDPARATGLARAAFADARGKTPDVYESLAAATASAGDFAEAVRLLDEVLSKAPADRAPAWVERLRVQRSLYAAGTPLRR